MKINCRTTSINHISPEVLLCGHTSIRFVFIVFIRLLCDTCLTFLLWLFDSNCFLLVYFYTWNSMASLYQIYTLYSELICIDFTHVPKTSMWLVVFLISRALSVKVSWSVWWLVDLASTAQTVFDWAQHFLFALTVKLGKSLGIFRGREGAPPVPWRN